MEQGANCVVKEVSYQITPTSGAPTSDLDVCVVCGTKEYGDANCDGSVELDDFVVWRADYINGMNSSCTNGDFDGDGRVELSDFVIWRSGYINGLPKKTLSGEIENPGPIKPTITGFEEY